MDTRGSLRPDETRRQGDDYDDDDDDDDYPLCYFYRYELSAIKFCIFTHIISGFTEVKKSQKDYYKT